MKRGLAIVAIVVGLAVGYVVLFMQPETPQQAGGGDAVQSPEPAATAEEAAGDVGAAVESAGDTAAELTEEAAEATDSAAERAADSVDAAEDTAGAAVEEARDAAEGAVETLREGAEQAARAAEEQAQAAGETAGALGGRAAEEAGAALDEATQTARAAADQAAGAARNLLDRALPGGALPEGPVTPEMIAGLDNPDAATLGALVDRAEIGLGEKAVLRGLLARSATDPSALGRARDRLAAAVAR